MKTAMVRAGAIGVGVALPLVLGVYLLADAVSGPLLITQPGADVAEKVSLGSVLAFTVLGGAAGIGLAMVVDRLGRGQRTFVPVCLVALLLYGIVPFTAAEEPVTAVWLNAMHVAAAVPIVGLLARAMEQDRGIADSAVAALQEENV